MTTTIETSSCWCHYSIKFTVHKHILTKIAQLEIQVIIQFYLQFRSKTHGGIQQDKRGFTFTSAQN